MPTLHEKSNPDLYRTVKDRNLEQQYFLLQTVVDVALALPKFKFTQDIFFSLHSAASTFLDHSPGRIRDDFVHIENSSHVPPAPNEIQGHLDDFFSYLNDNFETATTFHLAAYALWKITWIIHFTNVMVEQLEHFHILLFALRKGFGSRVI